MVNKDFSFCTVMVEYIYEYIIRHAMPNLSGDIGAQIPTTLISFYFNAVKERPSRSLYLYFNKDNFIKVIGKLIQNDCLCGIIRGNFRDNQWVLTPTLKNLKPRTKNKEGLGDKTLDHIFDVCDNLFLIDLYRFSNEVKDDFIIILKLSFIVNRNQTYLRIDLDDVILMDSNGALTDEACEIKKAEWQTICIQGDYMHRFHSLINMKGGLNYAELFCTLYKGK